MVTPGVLHPARSPRRPPSRADVSRPRASPALPAPLAPTPPPGELGPGSAAPRRARPPRPRPLRRAPPPSRPRPPPARPPASRRARPPPPPGSTAPVPRLGRPSPRSASYGRILARPRSLSPACLPARPAVPCSRRVGPRCGLELSPAHGPDACATRSQHVKCGFARARVRAAFRRSSSCPRHDRLPPNPRLLYALITLFILIR
jgi:hypothetical protein